MAQDVSPPSWLDSRPVLAGRSGVPAHLQIERWLTDVIGRGELLPGDRLPREADFASQLGVSRMTLRQALATLEARGTVTRQTGRTGGTFINEPRIECDLTGLAGFTEQLRRSNVRAGARMVSAILTRATTHVAKELELDLGALVYQIVRVRTARREPVALMTSFFPAASCPGMLDKRLNGSLYELLAREYSQRPHTAREVLEPVIAQEYEAGQLQIAPGAPLMLIERTAFTASGAAIEHAHDMFRPDRIRVSLHTGIGVGQGAMRSAVTLG